MERQEGTMQFQLKKGPAMKAVGYKKSLPVDPAGEVRLQILSPPFREVTIWTI